MDFLFKDVISETMDAHIAKFSDTEAAADWPLKKLLTSSSFIAPTATFLRCQTDSGIAEDGSVPTKSSKREQFTAVATYQDIIDLPFVVRNRIAYFCHEVRCPNKNRNVAKQKTKTS